MGHWRGRTVKRRRTKLLSPKDRRMLSLTVGTISVCALAIVFIALLFHDHLSSHQIRVRADAEQIYIALEKIPIDQARIVEVTGLNGHTLRLFATRSEEGVPTLTIAACRRCIEQANRNWVSGNELICGHCRAPMPLPQNKLHASQEESCSLIPIDSTQSGGEISIRTSDLAAAGQKWFGWSSQNE